MIRSRSFLTLTLFLAILPTTGCMFHTRPVEDQISKAPLKDSTQQGLIDSINQQAEAIRTLKATADIDSSAGGVKKGPDHRLQGNPRVCAGAEAGCAAHDRIDAGCAHDGV